MRTEMSIKLLNSLVEDTIRTGVLIRFGENKITKVMHVVAHVERSYVELTFLSPSKEKLQYIHVKVDGCDHTNEMLDQIDRQFPVAARYFRQLHVTDITDYSIFRDNDLTDEEAEEKAFFDWQDDMKSEMSR